MTGASTPPAILASNLSRSFGAVKAVDAINLRVDPGEIYGLVGPDGAGKTTIMRLLCYALRADAGEASIAGYLVARQPERARALIGYLSQRFSMYEELTVLENIRFFAEVRGLPAREWRPRCMEILRFVGLDEFATRLAKQLSGGMRQKLGLAAALVHRPRILLLDEPTTGVDPLTRQDFWQLIIQLVSEQGVAVLISTPYMDEATRCRRVGFLYQGRMLIEGQPAELRARLQGRILEMAGPQDKLRALRHIAAADAAVENVQMFGDRLHLRVRAGKLEEVMTRLGNGDSTRSAITRLRPIPPQLEDVFIELSANAETNAEKNADRAEAVA